jgi:hypothetical protein
MTAGAALRRPRINLARVSRAVAEFALRHWSLFFALAVAVAVYAPSMRFFFDGDDFVVLGSVEFLGPRQYVADTFFMRDIVPNWRPLTGAVYALEWELFGLNPVAWRSVNLSVHLGSVALLYTLLASVTGRPAVGGIAALLFAVSGSHPYTVIYVTALPHLLATFFILASLLLLVSYARDGERNPLAFVGSFLAFGLAFLANEGAFVFAPVLAFAYVLFARRWRTGPALAGAARLAVHVAPFATLAAVWLAFYQSCTCEQLKFEDYFWGAHVFRNYGVYLSWLAFPSGHVPLDPGEARWWLAGAVAAALVAVAIIGPNIARVAVLGVALALLPFVPVEIWTASRYTYASVSFFAPVAAIVAYAAYDRLRGLHRYARWPATAAALCAVAAVAASYGWQTHAQDGVSGRNNERWSVLVDELRANYADVPDGTTIYIIDGIWSNPGWQYTWVPSVARAVYGDAAAFDLPRATVEAERPDPATSLFLEWTGDSLRPVAPELVLGR